MKIKSEHITTIVAAILAAFITVAVPYFFFNKKEEERSIPAEKPIENKIELNDNTFEKTAPSEKKSNSINSSENIGVDADLSQEIKQDSTNVKSTNEINLRKNENSNFKINQTIE